MSFASSAPSFVRADGKLRYFHLSVGSFNHRAAYMCTYEYVETVVTWKRHQSNTHILQPSRILCA